MVGMNYMRGPYGVYAEGNEDMYGRFGVSDTVNDMDCGLVK